MKTKAEVTESIDALSKKGACIEFFSAYQDMDITRMLYLCDKNGQIFFKPLGEAGTGSVYETGKNIWSALMEAFPTLDNTVQSQHYSEENNAVTCHVVIFGQQEKTFAGIPSKGLRFESDHIFIFHFNRDSKINLIEVEWDHNHFVNQLTGVY